MLREHVEKGDPRDVGNFAMMLWSLGVGITATPPAAQLKPLTLGTIKKLMPKPDSKGWIYTEDQIIETVRQVEAAHRITEGKP
jgi:hypothetical protein